MSPRPLAGRPAPSILRRALAPGVCGMLFVGLIIALLLALKYNFILEDCFISLRYARHLYEGHGPVFNPGEDRVEGYTNFLWMLLGAAHYFFTKWPENYLLLYNRIFGLLIVGTVWWELLRRPALRRHWLWLGVLLVACHENLHAWMSGGLETSFFAWLIILTVGRFLREEFHSHEAQRPWSAVAMSLALLTRPEAYMVGLILGACLVWRRLLFRRTSPGGWWRVLQWGGICAVIGGAHLLWRHSYYGDWLPNTFRAKVSGAYYENGIPFVRVYLDANYGSWALVAALGGLSLLAGLDRKGRHSAEACLLALLVGAYVWYQAYVGGDVFEFRLLAPTVALVALWIPMILETLRDWAWRIFGSAGRRGAGVLLALGGALLSAIVLNTASRNPPPFVQPLGGRGTPIMYYQAWNWAEVWRPAGVWFRKYALPTERLATGAAGIIPYESDLPTLDIHGLNDREVANMKLAARGAIGHEKVASWDDLRRRGVTYFFHDVYFKKSPTEWPEYALKDNVLIVVQLPNEDWMIFKAPQDPDALRRQLRERGAIVHPGPNENASEVQAKNQANRQRFTEFAQAYRQEREERMKASFFPKTY